MLESELNVRRRYIARHFLAQFREKLADDVVRGEAVLVLRFKK